MAKIVITFISILILTIIFIYDNYIYFTYNNNNNNDGKVETYQSKINPLEGEWKNSEGTITLEIDNKLNMDQYIHAGTYEEKVNSTYLTSTSNREFVAAEENIILKLISENKILYKTPKKTIYLYR